MLNLMTMHIAKCIHNYSVHNCVMLLAIIMYVNSLCMAKYNYSCFLSLACVI